MNRQAPEIHTERLILRGHRLDDLSAMTALWSDAEVVRYIGGRASTADEVWARLLRYAGAWALMGYGFWTIRDREDGRYLGEGGLLQARRDLGDAFDSVPEVGWALSPSAQGKGYAREAVAAILDWADARGMARTVCLIEPGNGPSIRLAEGLGYREMDRATYHGAAVNLYSRERG